MIRKYVSYLLFPLLLITFSISASTSKEGLKIISSSANAGYYYAFVVNEGTVYYETVYSEVIPLKEVDNKNVPVDTFSASLISMKYGSNGKGLAPGDTGYAFVDYGRTYDGYYHSVYGDIDMNPGEGKKIQQISLSTSEIKGNLGYYRCAISNTTSDSLYNCEAVLFFYTDTTRSSVSGIYPVKLLEETDALAPGASTEVMFNYQPLCTHIDSMVVAYGLKTYKSDVKNQRLVSLKKASHNGKVRTFPVNALGKNVTVINSNSILFNKNSKEVIYRK